MRRLRCASAVPAPGAMQQTAPMVVTDKPVARVNGVALTDRDLLREMFAIFPYARQHNGFPKAQEAAIRQGALEMIIFEELVYQDAGRRKLTIPTAKINQAEAEFKKQFHSPDEYQQYLQSEQGGSEQKLRESIKRSMLIEQVLKIDVENKSAITPAELQAYYVKNVAKYSQPESLQLSEHFGRSSAEADHRAGETSAGEGARRAEKSEDDEELPGFWITGGERLGRRFPGEHGRPQSGRTRQAAATDRESIRGHASGTGERADPD